MLNAVMETMSVEKKEKIEAIRPYKVGDIVEGTVIGIGRSAVYLDSGPQGTGIIYGREFLQEKEMLRRVKIGDKLAAKIIELENDEGYIELSVREAGRDLSWETLKTKKEQEEILTVKILGANKGGLLTEIQGIPAFLPVSQLSQEHYPRVENGDTSKILRELQKFMGKELEVQIMDLDQKEGKIILSEKSKERERIKQALSHYRVGDEVEGEITGIVDFGAFMRFSAGAKADDKEKLEGLIHISEIDWQIIEDPSKILQIGQKTKAKVIDIGNGKVSLSLKALKEDPWKDMEKKYKKYDIIQGRVTKFNSFGAFVEIEPKIQGLIHISEFGTRRNMEEKLTLEQTYSFQILELNPTEHRMSLRLFKPQETETPPEKTSDSLHEKMEGEGSAVPSSFISSSQETHVVDSAQPNQGGASLSTESAQQTQTQQEAQESKQD